MTCTELAATGLEPAAILVVAALILGLGLLVTLLRVHRGAMVALIVIVTVAVVAGVAWEPLGSSSAHAAAAQCSTDAPDALSIVQTSVMAGLAPDTAPAAITGDVTNISTDDTYIVDVTVSVIAVTKAAGAVAGTCDASDYVIVEPVMDVNEALAGGASTTFAGASIGFVDKPSNQDACQGAAVRLLYTTG